MRSRCGSKGAGDAFLSLSAWGSLIPSLATEIISRIYGSPVTVSCHPTIHREVTGEAEKPVEMCHAVKLLHHNVCFTLFPDSVKEHGAGRREPLCTPVSNVWHKLL